MHVILTVTLMTYLAVKLAVNASTSYPLPQPVLFYCHGDICNARNDHAEFCSDQYKMCRPCTDVLEDCFNHVLPQNCSSTCIKYHLEKKLTEAKEKTCAVPEEVYNGQHNGSLSGINNIGDILQFTCNDGYRLVGKSSIQCKEYGVWSNVPPTCYEKSCKPLPKLKDGRHNGSLTYLKPGDVVVTYCRHGYTLQGEHIIVCDSRGEWTHPLPICQRIMCIKPQPIRNLQWSESSSNTYEVGHTLEPTCDQNFIMEGPDLWNCSIEGTWASTAGEYMPVCLLKGESSEQNNYLPWIALGILLIFSTVIIVGLVTFVFRLRRQLQQPQDLQEKENSKSYTDLLDDNFDSEQAKFLPKKGELDEDHVSLRIPEQVRGQNVSSKTENDKRPVKESGAFQPQQPESANENTERKLSFAGNTSDLHTAQGNSALENIDNSNARVPVQQTINNEQDVGQKVLLLNGEINKDDVRV